MEKKTLAQEEHEDFGGSDGNAFQSVHYGARF